MVIGTVTVPDDGCSGLLQEFDELMGDAAEDDCSKYYNRWVIFTQIWQGNKLVNSTSSVAGCSKFKY